MASYVVHNRPGAGLEDAVFVREGFSSGAFLLTVVWALWHRLWLVAAVLFAGFAGIAVAVTALGLNENFASALSLLLSLWFGCEARNLQSRALAASGRPEIGLSHGRNLDEAEIRFYHGRPAASAAATATPLAPAPRLQAPDPLGIFGNV